MDKKVRNLAFLLLSFGLIFIMTCTIIGCNDTNSFVIIEGPTELLAEPDFKDAHGNKVIAVLEKGERGRIIHISIFEGFYVL